MASATKGSEMTSKPETPVLDLDLDELLTESVQLADAKRAKATGRKLTAEQSELLAANSLAEELELWEDLEVYAVVAEVHCDCGACSQQFRGWFVAQERIRGGKGRRLVRQEDHGGLPASVYRIREETLWCVECLMKEELPTSSPEDFDLLESLGEYLPEKAASGEPLEPFESFGPPIGFHLEQYPIPSPQPEGALNGPTEESNPSD